jgi:glutathione S-transferase
MKLYLIPQACSLAVDIVAREAGIPLDLAWIDLYGKKLKDGSDYLRVNPKGQVPALETDDGQFLTEGVVIVQYLADQRPEAGLLPAGPGLARYRVLEWLNFLSSELHKGFTPLFKPNTPDAYREIAKANLHKHLAWLDQVLAGRSYLHGEAFTVADAYCYTIVMWSHFHELDLAGWPHLTAYLARIEQRPSVQGALATEKEQLAREGDANA